MKLADFPTIECHPPERRRRTDIRICHGSCCCCCCCLHTVGGIIGAGMAPAFGKNNRAPLNYYYDEADDAPGSAKTSVSAVRMFWRLSLTATILAALIGFILGGRQGASGLAIGAAVGLVILLMVFPVIQLVCAVITLIYMAFSSRSDNAYQVRQVGRIVLGLFAGTIAGIMAMAGIWLILSTL